MAFSPGGVDGVVSDGRSRLGSRLLPGVVPVWDWAKAPGRNRKPARASTVAIIMSFLIVYLPS
jgi:hypothetical protein